MTMNGAVLPVLALYIVAAEEQGVARREARRDHPERHPQGVHGPQHLHLPAGAVDARSSPTSSRSRRGRCRSSTRSRSPATTCRKPGATADLELGVHAGRRRRVHPRRARRGPDDRRVRAAAVVLLGDRHELLHGGGQDARRPPAVGEARQAVRPARATSRCRCARTARRRAGRSPPRTCSTTSCARASRRWRRRRATPSRCTPTRSTRRSRCRPTSRPASPATPSCSCSRSRARAGSSTRGAAATTSSGSPTSWRCGRGRTSQEVEAAGGMTEAIEAGIPKLRIEEAAARTQARIDSGRQPVIGVNMFRPDTPDDIDVLKVDNTAVRAQQIAKLAAAAGRARPGGVRRGAGPADRRRPSDRRRHAGQRPRAQPAQAGGRRRPGHGHRRRDQRRAGEGVRPAHGGDPYDQGVYRNEVGDSPGVAEVARARRPVRGEPRAAGRASSSPRWARTATTAARR